MRRAKILGNATEEFVVRLLSDRGYSASLLPTNYPTYDIHVVGTSEFFVSVKASASKQHVRLGSRRSVERLTSDSFVFALMPKPGKKELVLCEGGYRLLIIPGDVAKYDSIALSESYAAHRGIAGEYGYSLMVKEYSKRQHQIEIWSKWAAYEDAWATIPLAKITVAT